MKTKTTVYLIIHGDSHDGFDILEYGYSNLSDAVSAAQELISLKNGSNYVLDSPSKNCEMSWSTRFQFISIIKQIIL